MPGYTIPPGRWTSVLAMVRHGSTTHIGNHSSSNRLTCLDASHVLLSHPCNSRNDSRRVSQREFDGRGCASSASWTTPSHSDLHHASSCTDPAWESWESYWLCSGRKGAADLLAWGLAHVCLPCFSTHSAVSHDPATGGTPMRRRMALIRGPLWPTLRARNAAPRNEASNAAAHWCAAALCLHRHLLCRTSQSS